MATLFILVTTKHSNLILWCIDNHHLFLHYYAAFLFLHLVVRWIDQVIFHLIYILNLILVLKLALFFIWRFTYAVLGLLRRSWIDFLWSLCLWVEIMLYMPVCAVVISSWVRKGLSMAKTHMSLGTLGYCSFGGWSFLGVHSAGRWLGHSFHSS